MGAAGSLLNTLLRLAGLERRMVYITNVVKCRPPGNRDPRPEEIRACLPFLERQIKLIKPRVIVALGRHAGKTLFQLAGLRWPGMSKAHGRPVEAELLGLKVVLYPVYHPAAALYNPQLRRVLEEDFRRLPSIAGTGRRRRSLLDYM